MNPLLAAGELLAYTSIRPTDIQPAVTRLLEEAELAVAVAVDASTPADYTTLSRVLDVPLQRLSAAWGAAAHLNSVIDSAALRDAYNAMLPVMSEFSARLGSNDLLCAKYKAVLSGGTSLSPARRRELEQGIRDLALSGADLSGPPKARFAAIAQRSAVLCQQFVQNVQDATDRYAYYACEDELIGVPAHVRVRTRAAAHAENRQGHKIGLQAPDYVPIMKYAESRALRESLYRAYTSRASELGDAENDNSAVLEEIVGLRNEAATLLGYSNHAVRSLVSKMAGSPAQVQDFLLDLARRARSYAQDDLARLRAFAGSTLRLADLRAWDLAFASERLMQAGFAFSNEEVRAYFTLPRVLAGLFEIAEDLFDCRIIERRADVWHDDVRYYRFERNGELIGHAYFDLFARASKRPGAWMNPVRRRWMRPDGTLQAPIAIVVCNFAAPFGEQPAMLAHEDVTTLFHEFGHTLHHLLTSVDELGISGIAGVEWDAVELPSQFMENFCWEREVLAKLTRHVSTGEPLPAALFDKMLAARNFQAGLLMLRQVEHGLFDMRLHSEPGGEHRVQEILDAVRREVAVFPVPECSRFQHSFLHIFAGGYAAGYYSYKWAEVLSADAWSAFEEEGVLNSSTGFRYRKSILETGGSRSAAVNFEEFRGRAPRIDALLRYSGMAG